MKLTHKEYPRFIQKLQGRMNQLLDRVQPSGALFHFRISMFQLWGYLGLTLALLLGQPVLVHLDIAISGECVFYTCGRAGRLMVGCCHIRPHSWGVCHREEHAAAGFADYPVEVRLFPNQAVESLFVGLVALVGTWLVVSGRPLGTALAWYVVAYDLAVSPLS